jgi:hypothetical protein
MFTSLKALKWSYKLGVDRERERIAGYLQQQIRRSRVFNEAALDMMRDPATKREITQKRKQRLELQMAVNDQIQEIVNGLFIPEHEQYVPGTSVMFPDEPKGRK